MNRNRYMTRKGISKVDIAAAALGIAIAVGIAAGDAFAANEPWEEGITMNVPYGQQMGQENRAYDPSTRDANGNRLIVKGYSQYSNTAGVASEGSGVGEGSALAVGNQLNVVTSGSNNTVIVNSTQINNGDQEANVVLNGKLDLD